MFLKSLFLIGLLMSAGALAQGPAQKKSPHAVPKPLFDRPVKVDPSGKPLYNSWQKQEYERQVRHKYRQMHDGESKGVEHSSPESLYHMPNAATSDTLYSPSSVITNRPIQKQNQDRSGEDTEFDKP